MVYCTLAAIPAAFLQTSCRLLAVAHFHNKDNKFATTPHPYMNFELRLSHQVLIYRFLQRPSEKTLRQTPLMQSEQQGFLT